MTMNSFTLHRPKTLTEALEILETHVGDVRIVAGGSDLVINMRMRIEMPAHVIDLRGVKELRGVSFDEREGLKIGALTTVAEIVQSETVRERFSVVASAAKHVAGPNIRNMGTLGGNLLLDTRCVYYNQSYFWRKSNNFCLKKDGDVCHVAPGGKKCWAAYSGDIAPALLTLDASVRLVSIRGERTVPLTEFFINDGILKYDLKPDEILCDVRVPAESADYQGVYNKYRVRDSIDYPLAGAAVTVKTDSEGICTDARVAITATNPSPRVVSGIKELLIGERINSEGFNEKLERAAELVRAVAKPMRTTVIATSVYRRNIIGVLAKRAIAQAIKPENSVTPVDQGGDLRIKI